MLDGRFDSQRPGRTLWNLFADQPGRVAVAVTLYIIKQTPASLLPLAVGMIVDALTTGGRKASRTNSLAVMCWRLAARETSWRSSSGGRLMVKVALM